MDNTVERILSYIDSVADFSREDRLYPADPTVFESNPLSLGHGACGVAYVMHRVRGHVDPRVMDWIRARKIRPEAYSPGLYTGMAGIAWTMLDMGYKDEAEAILEKTKDHHLLWRSADVFNGAAGWGMAQLRFFIATRNPAYLEQACRAGRFLLQNRQFDSQDASGCFWSTPEGISASFGHGASGISLFLLYLSLASGDESYLDAGRQGLEWRAELVPARPHAILSALLALGQLGRWPHPTSLLARDRRAALRRHTR